ncbi:MAG: VIT1/CCC1 transporter family protein [Candidatus Kerfeldbacteria bacterium]|nr:VIT1/CCC1 transporter family protein [Candidatus Kerfeldbacteria bacterium]
MQSPETSQPPVHLERHSLVGQYLRDVVFGANDGLITTFATVAGAAGAHLPTSVVIILGLANVFADGVSMGLGEYLGSNSERAYYHGQKNKEEWEVLHEPKAEEREVQEVFRSWGFTGKALSNAVNTIKKDQVIWVDFMMKHELGLFDIPKRQPMVHGAVMFVAFFLAGLLPLTSFFAGADRAFPFSIFLTALALFSIGALRSLFTPVRWWRGGLEMLIVGGAAGTLAFVVGKTIATLAGI